MDFLVELIGDIAMEIWAACAGKMFDPCRSRAKRMLFFLLCCLPVSAVLVLIGVIIYERTDIVRIIIACAFYVLAALISFFLGRCAWRGRAPREPKLVEKMGNGIERFIVAYKNTLRDKNAPMKTRVALFLFPFVPFCALAAFLAIFLPEAAGFIIASLAVVAVCAVLLARRIFGKK